MTWLPQWCARKEFNLSSEIRMECEVRSYQRSENFVVRERSELLELATEVRPHLVNPLEIGPEDEDILLVVQPRWGGRQKLPLAPCAAFRYSAQHLGYVPVQATLPNRGRNGASEADLEVWLVCEELRICEEFCKGVLTVGTVEGITPVDHEAAAAEAREKYTGEQTEDTVTHSGRSLDEENARGARSSHPIFAFN